MRSQVRTGTRARLKILWTQTGISLSDRKSCRRITACGSLTVEPQSPTRNKCFIIERHYTEDLLKLDGVPEALFRLLEAAHDARVALIMQAPD